MDQKREWVYDKYSENQIIQHKVKSIIAQKKTKFQEIEILDLYNFGASVFIDRIPQSSSRDEWIYHECLAHPAVLLNKKKEHINVLILGTGEGAVSRELLKHESVDKIVSIDVDYEAVQLFKKNLPNMHKGSFSNKKVQLLYENAVDFLKKTDEKFDVIISDITDVGFFNLGAKEINNQLDFYRLINKSLTKNGILAMHLDELGEMNFSKYIKFKKLVSKVFKASYSYRVLIPFFMRQWGFLILTNDLRVNPLNLSVKDFDNLLSGSKIKDLKYINSRTIYSIFSFPNELREILKK